MKTFKTYHELYEAYKRNEVPFCILQENASIVSEAAELDIESPPSVTEEFAEKVYNKLERIEENSFSWLTGGDLFICETEEDLKQILGCDFGWTKTHNNQWPSVVDLPMSWDACDYVLNDPKTGWVLFLLCWNNAGVPIYYVPKSLWGAARLEEHMKVHKETWNADH